MISANDRILFEGRLEKRGQLFKTWKPRWFILTADRLSYFESKPYSDEQYENLLKGSISLQGASVHVTEKDYQSREFLITLEADDKFVIIDTFDEDIRDAWITNLTLAIRELNEGEVKEEVKEEKEEEVKEEEVKEEEVKEGEEELKEEEVKEEALDVDEQDEQALDEQALDVDEQDEQALDVDEQDEQALDVDQQDEQAHDVDQQDEQDEQALDVDEQDEQALDVDEQALDVDEQAHDVDEQDEQDDESLFFSSDDDDDDDENEDKEPEITLETALLEKEIVKPKIEEIAKKPDTKDKLSRPPLSPNSRKERRRQMVAEFRAREGYIPLKTSQEPDFKAGKINALVMEEVSKLREEMVRDWARLRYLFD